MDIKRIRRGVDLDFLKLAERRKEQFASSLLDENWLR